MKMKKTIVKDRLFSRQQTSGQVFTKQSLTIPGQALSPLEIMKLYIKNRDNIKPLYSDQDLHSLTKLDKVQQAEFKQKLKKDISDLSDKYQKLNTPLPGDNDNNNDNDEFNDDNDK